MPFNKTSYDYAYICTDFPPINNAGAVRNKFFIDDLLSKNNKIKIFTSVKNNKYDIKKISSHLPTNIDSNFVRLLKEFIYGIEIFIKIIISPSPDIYILSPPPFFITVISIVAIKLKGRNYILDIRDLYPDVYFANKILKQESLLGAILKKIEKWIYDNSKLIITVTDGITLKISNQCPNANVKTVRNGFDSDLFIPANKQYDDFTLIFHGNLSRFQDVELLINIFKQINKIDNSIYFLVIGNGSKDILLKDLLIDNFTYIPTINYKEIPAIISKCHIGLSFRTNDVISRSSFPVKVFEYIGVGIPILVTPRSEGGDCIEKKKLGFQFESEDQDGIIRHILEIKKNYAMFCNENKSIRDYFSRQKQAELFTTYLKNIKLSK